MKNRPAGSTAAIASLIVLIASYKGIDLSAEAAVTIVGALTAIVSLFYPLPDAE